MTTSRTLDIWLTISGRRVLLRVSISMVPSRTQRLPTPPGIERGSRPNHHGLSGKRRPRVILLAHLAVQRVRLSFQVARPDCRICRKRSRSPGPISHPIAKSAKRQGRPLMAMLMGDRVAAVKTAFTPARKKRTTPIAKAAAKNVTCFGQRRLSLRGPPTRAHGLGKEGLAHIFASLCRPDHAGPN